MGSTRETSAFIFLIAVIAFASVSAWLGYGVHQVERLRREGIPIVAQVTGTQIRHSSDGTEVRQTYAFSLPQTSVRYSGTFTPG